MNCLCILTKIIMKKRSITEILSAMLNHFPQHLLLLHHFHDGEAEDVGENDPSAFCCRPLQLFIIKVNMVIWDILNTSHSI